MKKTMFCLTGLAAMGLAAAVTIDPGKGVAASPGKITGTTDVDIFSGIVTMDPENDYVGVTRITNGTLIASKLALAGNPSSIGSSGPIDVGNAIFRYTGAEPATIDRPFTNTVSKLNGTNVVEVLDLQSDVTFTKLFSSGYMPLVKTGPGAMITKDTVNIISGEVSGNGYKAVGLDNTVRAQFPEDGTAPKNGVTVPLTLLDGSIIVKSGTFRTSQTGVRGFIGAWTADYGETEKDVYLPLDGGNVVFNTLSVVGQRHGFADYNTPNGPAKAYVTINSGTLTQGGGQGFYLGSYNGAPTVKINGVDTALTLNSDVRLTVNSGGTFTHGTSFAGLHIRQHKGQPIKILLDGGTLQDYAVKIGGSATANDATGVADIEICNRGTFRCETFTNNISGKANPPPVNVRVTSGSTFRADNVYNRGSGTLNFYLDGCTLGNYGLHERFTEAGMRKFVLGSTVTSAQLGTNAVTLQATKTYGGKPFIAVFAAPLTTSSELVAAGEPDGGVIINNNTPSNVVEFAAAMAYAGPTTLTKGILAFSGSGALPPTTAFTMTDGTLVLDGNRVLTVGSAILGSASGLPTLELGPGAALAVSGAVAFSGVVGLSFVDASGNVEAAAVTHRPVMTVADGYAAAVRAAKFRSGSASLTLTGLSLESNGDGTSTLYASAVPAASLALTSSFIKSTISVGSSYVIDVSAGLADGTYVVATFAKTGDESWLDLFGDVVLEWKNADLLEEATATPGVWAVKMTLATTSTPTGEWIPVSAGGSWNVAANWTGDVPDGVGRTAYFPEAAAADVPVAVDSDVTLGSVVFSAGATPGGYRLSGGGSLTLASNVAVGARPGIDMDVAADAAAHVHSIAVPVVADCAQNWGVPTNQTLVLEKGVTAPALTISSGAATMGGKVVLSGTNVIDGRLVMSNGVVVVNGKITASGGVDESSASSAGATTIYARFANDETAAYLTMSNAVIEKPLFINVGRSVDPRHWWHVAGATTNVISSYLYFYGQSGAINYDGPGARVELRGGGMTSYSFGCNGSPEGTEVYVGGKPFNFYSYRVGYKHTLILDVPGSKFRNKDGTPCGIFAEGTNGKVDFRVSYAMEGVVHGNGQTGFVFEFNATTQRIDTVGGLYNSTFNGTYPAMCEIVSGHPEETAGNRLSNICCRVTGGLGFIMSGPSTICLSNKVFESHGDIAVVSGKMVFAKNASWLNGTNVTVAGTGTLRINAADTFSRSHAVIRFADSGKVEVPSGVMQTFAEGWDGETKLVSGRTYTAANLPARVTGGGAIRIAGAGFSVFIR